MVSRAFSYRSGPLHVRASYSLRLRKRWPPILRKAVFSGSGLQRFLRAPLDVSLFTWDFRPGISFPRRISSGALRRLRHQAGQAGNDLGAVLLRPEFVAQVNYG